MPSETEAAVPGMIELTTYYGAPYLVSVAGIEVRGLGPDDLARLDALSSVNGCSVRESVTEIKAKIIAAALAPRGGATGEGIDLQKIREEIPAARGALFQAWAGSDTVARRRVESFLDNLVASLA